MKLKTYRNIMLLAALIITATIFFQQPSIDAGASPQPVASELKPLPIPTTDTDWTKSSEFCSTQVANIHISNGTDTREELDALGINGRPYEIVDAHVKAVEEQKQVELRAKIAKQKAQQQVKVATVPKSTPQVSAPVAGRWEGSHEEWDAIARQTLFNSGCNDLAVEQMMAIHHKEGGPNSINAKGPYYGGWQMSTGIIASIPGQAWWDPVLSTQRAYSYVMGRYGSVANAYNHKLSTGWY